MNLGYRQFHLTAHIHSVHHQRETICRLMLEDMTSNILFQDYHYNDK